MDEKKKRLFTNYGLLLGAILISIFAVLFLIFSLMKLVHSKKKPEYTVTAHLYGSLDSSRTRSYKDAIYYSDAQGLHSFSDEKLVNAELSDCLLNVYSDKLYLYKPATGEVYSYDGKNTDRLFAVNKQQEHFIVCEGMIITLAEDDHGWINVSYFDLESGKSTALSGAKCRKMHWDNKHGVEFTEVGGHIFMTDEKDPTGFFEILDKSSNSAVFVISRDGFYIHKTDGENAFFATAYNTSTGRAVNRYTCDAENKLTLDKVICDEAVHEYPRYFFSDEKYSYVYMQVCSTVPKTKFSDRTDNISECRVIIIDKETMRTVCKVVAPRKVISVDNSRFIAFENGELLVYDSKTLEKLGGYRPKGVKEGGKYIFENCGGYVFVFDSDSGKRTDTVRL